jgi:capsular exopolysaccharide synthesis family protein
MDHLTGILERAERDGAVRRLRTNQEPPTPIRPNPPPLSVAEKPAAPPVETAPAASPVRILAARLDPTVVTATAPDSAAAERYRAMRTRILHADHGTAVRVLLVTSAGENEGKSVTAANLAVGLAQGQERRVCLVDANLRSPRIDRLFGIPRQPGLAEVLAGRNTLEEAIVNLDGIGLTVLSAGTPHPRPAELLVTSAMRRTMDELRSQFDFVVVDTPGIQPLADVGSLTPFVDSVLLVARAGVTSKTAVREAASALGSTTVLGIVLNEAA